MILSGGFTFESTAAAWDEGAEAWDEFVESGADFYRTEVHGPGLLQACGDVTELRILDAGCGQGWFTRQLAIGGARCVGVDISPRQIQNARQHEARMPLGIEYYCQPVESVGESLGGGDFDMVTACMSVHDMPRPDAAMQAVAGILRPGQRFVFSIPHPVTDSPYREWERKLGGEKGPLKINWYFESTARTLDWSMRRLKYSWKTPYWGRTLAEWTATVSEAGFVTKRLHEPRPTADQVQRLPDLDDCYRLPYCLVFDCVRS